MASMIFTLLLKLYLTNIKPRRIGTRIVILSVHVVEISIHASNYDDLDIKQAIFLMFAR